MKSFIRRCFRQIGLDVRRYHATSSQAAQYMQILAANNINLVFDVGANTGDFGQLLRESGYRGRIVSFEPLSSVRNQLLKASNRDLLWEIAPPVALGNENGEIDIHVAGNSVSSSILNMLDAHAIGAPASRYIRNERVSLRRLDSLAPDYIGSDSITLLKIDTQGYEDRVLQGAAGIMDRIIGLQIELTLVPLYEGGKLFEEMLEKIKAMRFELWSMWPAFTDQTSGRLLQVDATFFRNKP